ncbi:MAG: PQQ-binding-like beta-propeller repeat protein [Actinomycetia bacterium]|nr:PQQ-binding-like beta-propeller repeat protein [Actinomycetes bacterium]
MTSRRWMRAGSWLILAVIVTACLYVAGCKGNNASGIEGLEPLDVEWKTSVGTLGGIISTEEFIIARIPVPSDVTDVTQDVKRTLNCVDSTDGNIIWAFAGVSNNCDDIQIHGDEVIVVDEDNRITFLDLPSGRVIRQLDIFKGKKASVPMVTDTGVDYSINVTGFAISDSILVVAIEDGGVSAFDKASGKQVWSVELPFGNLGFTPSPLIKDGLVIQRGHNLYAYNLEDGEPVWSNDVISPRGGVFFEDSVIVWQRNGLVQGIDLNSGETIWSRELRSTLEDIFTVSGDKFYVFSTVDRKKDVLVYQLRVDNGEVVWQKNVDERFVSGAVTHNEALYFIANSGNVYAISCLDGKELRGFEVGNITFAAGITQSAGKICTGGNPFLFAFKAI